MRVIKSTANNRSEAAIEASVSAAMDAIRRALNKTNLCLSGRLNDQGLGRVDLCCTSFGLNGSILITKKSFRPSGLSQRAQIKKAATKSKMLP